MTTCTCFTQPELQQLVNVGMEPAHLPTCPSYRSPSGLVSIHELQARLAAAEKDRDDVKARNAELTQVAAAVESIVADVAQHGRAADAPFISLEEAQQLLAIIRAPGRGSALLQRLQALESAIRDMLANDGSAGLFSASALYEARKRAQELVRPSPASS